MPDAIDKATRINEIGFAEFTADLIQSTFQAIVAANQAQMKDYQELVSAVSKTTSEYINQTKLEVTGEEVLGFLENLPPFLGEDGEPLTVTVGTGQEATQVPLAPEELRAGDQLPALALHQLNKQLDIGAIAGGVVDVLGGIKSLFDKNEGLWLPEVAGQPPTYDPAVFETIDLEALVPPPVFTLVDKDATDHIGALYEAVAKRVSLDKYTLLKDMVKLGVLRLVINTGLIESAITFQTWEREYQSSSSYERKEERVKDKMKTRRKSGGGLLGFLHKRDRTRSKSKHKETQLQVKTVSENQGSSSGTSITILGRVVLNFATDYQPVSTI